MVEFLRSPTVALARLRKPCRAWVTPNGITLQGPNASNDLLRKSLSFESSPEKSLEHACKLLIGMWQKAEWHHRALHIMLSDDWIRPLVIPVTAAPMEQQRALELLETQYRRIYGEAMRDWTITWQQIDDRLIGMACPSAAIQCLKNGLSQSNSQLATMGPLSIPILKTFPDFDIDYLVLCIYEHSISIIRVTNNQIKDWSSSATHVVNDELIMAQLKRYRARKVDPCKNIKIVDISRKIDMAELSNLLDADQWQHDAIGLNQLWRGGVGEWFRLIQSSVA
jgi:hypothetical protein